MSGETEIVDLLIKAGADIDIQDEVSKKKSWDVNSICQLATLNTTTNPLCSALAS